MHFRKDGGGGCDGGGRESGVAAGVGGAGVRGRCPPSRRLSPLGCRFLGLILAEFQMVDAVAPDHRSRPVDMVFGIRVQWVRVWDRGLGRF